MANELLVPAKEITLVLKAGGTVEEYEAKAQSVKVRLRQELQQPSPAVLQQPRAHEAPGVAPEHSV